MNIRTFVKYSTSKLRKNSGSLCASSFQKCDRVGKKWQTKKTSFKKEPDYFIYVKQLKSTETSNINEAGNIIRDL